MIHYITIFIEIQEKKPFFFKEKLCICNISIFFESFEKSVVLS